MRIRRPDGVTLLELLIGISVLSLVVFATFSVYHWIAKAERESSYRHAMEDLRLEVMRSAFSETALELAITQRDDGLSALNVNLAKCLIEEMNPPFIACPAERFPIMLFSKLNRLSGFGVEAPSQTARVLYRRNGSICPVGAENDDNCVIEITSTARCIYPDCRAGDVNRVKKLEIAVKIEWTKPVPGMAISPIEIVQPVTLQPHGLKDVAHISATEEIPNILAAIVVPTPASAAPTESKPPQPLSMAFVKQPIPSITPIEIPHETPPPMFVTKPEGQKPPEDPECRPEARPFGGGNGSEANPYKICAAEQLQNIQMALNSAFELSSDINVTGFAFRPIGEKRGPFVGTLNGRQHAIRNLTLVDSIGSEPLGLFSRIGGGARIQNLSLVDASVSNQNALAKNRCMGIVAGSVEGAATLDHVQANGRLSSGAGESVIAGGIVGCAQDVSLKNCGFIGEFDHFTIKAPSIAAGAIGAVGGKSLLSTLNVRIESIDAREKSKLKVAGLIGEVRSPTVEVRRAIVRNATHHAVAGFGSCAGIDGKRFSDIYVEFTTDESVKASPACAGEVRLYSCPDSQHLKPKTNCEGPLYRWKDEFKLPAYCPEKACWPSSSQ